MYLLITNFLSRHRPLLCFSPQYLFHPRIAGVPVSRRNETCSLTIRLAPASGHLWRIRQEIFAECCMKQVLSLIVAGNSFRCRTETVSVSVCKGKQLAPVCMASVKKMNCLKHQDRFHAVAWWSTSVFFEFYTSPAPSAVRKGSGGLGSREVTVAASTLLKATKQKQQA